MNTPFTANKINQFGNVGGRNQRGSAAAKKYGSWDYAYHDTAIVYAAHPYILVCMTDQGDAAVDFPPAATAAMQELGKRVYEGLND